VYPSYAPAEAGVTGYSAPPGEFGDLTQPRGGGYGGTSLTINEAAQIVLPGIRAGGGGGGGLIGVGGGDGGGSFAILARERIDNNPTGVIRADGTDADEVSPIAGGGGGGAGGIVTLASPGGIHNEGTITCNGGDGATSNVADGAGGGGGGGIIHFFGPRQNLGATFVDGGAAGELLGAGTVVGDINGFISGGAAGGACGGRGGSGGGVGLGGTPNAAEHGASGHVIVTIADPTSLF
jgi:hypothetical protein